MLNTWMPSSLPPLGFGVSMLALMYPRLATESYGSVWLRRVGWASSVPLRDAPWRERPAGIGTNVLSNDKARQIAENPAGMRARRPRTLVKSKGQTRDRPPSRWPKGTENSSSRTFLLYAA
jgi:hypothetical protein